MKTIVLYILVILVFNISILLLPILIFLLSLTFPSTEVFDLFLWLYIPLAICSPILTLVLNCKIALQKTGIRRWFIPIITSVIGFSPVWLTYFSISAILTTLDLILIFFTPILLGLTSAALAHVVDVIFYQRSLFFPHK